MRLLVSFDFIDIFATKFLTEGGGGGDMSLVYRSPAGTQAVLTHCKVNISAEDLDSVIQSYKLFAGSFDWTIYQYTSILLLN